MPQNEFETIFTANQEIQETHKKEGDIGRGAVAAGKLMLLGASFAALLAAMWLLWVRIESLRRYAFVPHLLVALVPARAQ